MNTVQTGTSYVAIWFIFYVYKIQGEPEWIVNEKVSGYGDSLTLFCLIDDCCTKAAGWVKFDPDYETIYFDVRNSTNNTSKDKYAATTNNTGFSLVIKNIQKEDINIKYSCLYGFEKSRQKVLRQSDAFREYPTKVNVLAIVLGVLIGIVLVGLALLLIWKLVTTINDRRELARFEKETKDAKWDTGEHPVYKPATSTYKNPTYAGK